MSSAGQGSCWYNAIPGSATAHDEHFELIACCCGPRASFAVMMPAQNFTDEALLITILQCLGKVCNFLLLLLNEVKRCCSVVASVDQRCLAEWRDLKRFSCSAPIAVGATLDKQSEQFLDLRAVASSNTVVCWNLFVVALPRRRCSPAKCSQAPSELSAVTFNFYFQPLLSLAQFQFP